MSPDRQHLFIHTTAAIFQARQEVTDLFFQHKVMESIHHILQSHVQCCLVEESDFILRRSSDRDHLKALNEADSIFEEVSYLKKGDLIDFNGVRERILFYVRAIPREEI